VIQIVFTRYLEPEANWFHLLKNPYIVYNTHERYPNNLIPNIGNSEHTIIRYICDNYYKLPSIIMFLQYYPFDHCIKERNYANISNYVNVIKRINNCPQDLKTVYPIGIVLHENVYEVVKRIKQEDKDQMLSRYKSGICGISPQEIACCWEEIYKTSFNNEVPKKACGFIAGSNFAIPKNLITANPIEFYGKLLNCFKNAKGPETHAMERMWEYVFKYKV